MLTNEELLLFQAVKDEEQRQQSMQAAGLLGAGVGGVALGSLGNAAHQVGRGLNALAGRKPRVGKPGMRLAGGLTGTILGGALGAGVSALMQQESDAARLMAKMQTGNMDEFSTKELENLLAAAYNKPSQLM